MPASRRSRSVVLAIVLATSAAFPVLATTWVVDRENLACSDAGPGDAITPFCTIDRGATASVSGDIVLVHPGTYREQVVPTSGAPGTPITYLAAGPGVRILGTDDLSDALGWSPTATHAWARHFAPASNPTQVFVDGVPLAKAASAGTTTTGSFFYDDDADTLHVDVGGGNPALGHVVEAGARAHGFNLPSRSYLVVEGFEIEAPNTNGVRIATAGGIILRDNTIAHTGSRGVQIESATGPITLSGNEVSFSGAVGIRVLDSTGVTMERNLVHDNANHGIGLTGSSGNTFVGNILHHNAVPGGVSAVGLELSQGSSNNVVRANTAFLNQDSGFDNEFGSNGNLFVRNVSYRNGDHGFDARDSSTGNRYVSNTSFGNFKDGFSVEGSSTGATFANNIAMDNGLTTAEFDLYVDPSSVSGFSSDYDIFWKSVPGTVVRVNAVFYASLQAFAAATGQEAHGIGADPLFRDAGAGDLRLRLGPAVDSADAGAAGFSPEDHDGILPFDIPAIADTGSGVPPYADRGAFEYVEAPPVAQLRLSPHGRAPLTVTADASKSKDDVGIASFTFDFGDGTTVGPQSGATAAHTYPVPGRYDVTVTVTDTAGLTDVRTRKLHVGGPR